jgi:hypothetical protein
MGDTAHMVDAVNKLTDLNPIRIGKEGLKYVQQTFSIVRSQLSSFLFSRLMSARGTIQSLRGGGLG